MELLLWTCQRWAETFLQGDYPGGLFIKGLDENAGTRVDLYVVPTLREGREMAKEWGDKPTKIRVTIEEVTE
jgi:hypothetical protein